MLQFVGEDNFPSGLHHAEVNPTQVDGRHLNGIEGAMHSILLAELENNFNHTAHDGTH
jgi:hypothetical protein